ncbi:hypothetical protein ACFLXG_03100 [Chloroflexota bacterium]
MDRKGLLLEIITKRTQEFLQPEGIRTEHRKTYWRNNRKIAEVDVIVSSKIVTSKVTVGIECRNRPSAGRQGLPWIWEIYGKLRYLPIDKMTAVSGTGFTKEAIQLAQELNINLIDVSNTSDLKPNRWFKKLGIQYNHPSGITSSALFELRPFIVLSENRIICLTGTTQIDTDYGKTVVLAFAKQKGEKNEIRFDFLTENLQDQLLRQGTKFTLVGY